MTTDELHSLIQAIVNNDDTTVRRFIDNGGVQAHDCLALRTAVYAGNLSMTHLLLPHSDVFAYNANAVHLAIDNGFNDIFTALYPYIVQKNDRDKNYEFLLRAVESNETAMVEMLAPISNLDHADCDVFFKANPHNERLYQHLINAVASQKLEKLANNLALVVDVARLQLVVSHLGLEQTQRLHDTIVQLNHNGFTLSDKGLLCLDVIDQHRQKCVLLHTAACHGTHKTHKI